MNEVEKIQNEIKRRAVRLKTGGFKPTNGINESWIGKVYLYRKDEEIPLDKDDNPMLPLFQLCLADFPFVPESLESTEVITVFISGELPMDLVDNGQDWILREYSKDDVLGIKDLGNSNSNLKAFPLQTEIIEDDYPVWDGGGLTNDQVDKIIKLEKENVIDGYYDISENKYGHKVGGYPSFCQPGINFGEGYEFVFQIASDNKSQLNIVDGGTIFLAKNNETNQWKFYCDFY